MATELLARLGIELDVAANGRDAIAMAEAAPTKYAAILMDVQMPEVDGLAATRALRADSRFATVPIIAMTANAMKADLDDCLLAGMNDHVTKPIDRKALVATLRRWLPARPHTSLAEASAVQVNEAVAPALEGIDVNGTLERLGIERASLERMLLRFADGSDQMIDAVHAAVAAGDAAATARHAHAIAGAAGNLGADALRAAAKALEQAARDGRADCSALLAVVETRAAVVFTSIARLRPQASFEGETATGPFDSSIAGAALERLTVALDGYDLSSTSVALADLATAGLPAWASDDLGRLRRCVDAYEYAEARQIASRLLTRVHGAGA